MGISQRIRKILNQTQESAVTTESQEPSLDQFDENIRGELAKYLKRQIPRVMTSSKKAAIERLQHAQSIAISCEKKDQNVLATQMTEYFKDNFYLTDYLHVWLNIDKEKLQKFEEQKSRIIEANDNADIFTRLIESLKETIVTRKEILLICLDKPEFNRKLNDEARVEVIERVKTGYFNLDPMLEKYMEEKDKQEVSAQIMNSKGELIQHPLTEMALKINDPIQQEARTRRIGILESLNRKITIMEKPLTKDQLNKHNPLSSKIAVSKESANKNNKKVTIKANRKITVYLNNWKSPKSRRRFVFIRRQIRKLNFKNRQKISLLVQQAKADKKASKKVGDYFGYHR